MPLSPSRQSFSRNAGWLAGKRCRGHFMEIVLASSIGLAVACVVFVVGRTFVGSSRSAEQDRPRPNEATGLKAESFVQVDPPAPVVLPQPEPAIEPTKRVRKRSASADTLNKPRSPRTRKSAKTTLPGSEVIQ